MKKIKNIGIAILYVILGIIKLPITIVVAIFHTIEIVLMIAMTKILMFSTMEKFRNYVASIMEINSDAYFDLYDLFDDIAGELEGWKL